MPFFCLILILSRKLLLHAVDEAFDGGNRLVHHRLLFGVEFELDDLLEPLFTDYRGNAHIVTFHSEFSLEKAAGRKDT